MDKICFNTCIFNFYITLTHISACFISLSATSKTNKPLRQKPMAIHKSNSLPRSNPRAENKINSPAAAREYYKQTPRLNVRNQNSVSRGQTLCHHIPRSHTPHGKLQRI